MPVALLVLVLVQAKERHQVVRERSRRKKCRAPGLRRDGRKVEDWREREGCMASSRREERAKRRRTVKAGKVRVLGREKEVAESRRRLMKRLLQGTG